MPDPIALTKTQRRLRTEVEEIASAIRMDVWEFLDAYDPEARTDILRIMNKKTNWSEAK